MKKFLSLILALSLVLGCSGCGGQTPSAAESSAAGASTGAETTTGDTEEPTPAETYEMITEQTDLDTVALHTGNYSFTKGEMLYFFAMTFRNYYQYFVYFGVDTSVSLKEQNYLEDQTWFDLIMAEAMNYGRSYLYFAEAANDRGLTLTQEDLDFLAEQKATLDAEAASYGWSTDTYIEQLFGTNLSWDILESTMQKMLLADRGYNAFVGELEDAVTEDGIAAEYEANKKTMDYIDFVVIDMLDAEILSDEAKDNAALMMQLIAEMEAMADGCLNIAYQLKKAIEKEMTFDKEDFDRLLPYFELARQLMYFIYKNVAKIQRLTPDEFQFASELEQQIDDERIALKKLARSRLESGRNVRSELLYMDIIRQIEKIGDRCFDAAGELR